MLANRTQLNGYISQLEKLKLTIETQVQPDFDTLIENQRVKLFELELEVNKLQETIDYTENQLDTFNAKLIEINTEKAKISGEELTAYNTAYTELNNKKVKLEVEISSLNKEISKLKSITDTCPTCGQHLPNVHKPDTSELELSLNEKQSELIAFEADIQKCNKQHDEYQSQIHSAFIEELTMVTRNISSFKNSLQENKTKHHIFIVDLERERAANNKLIYDKQNWSIFIKKQQEEIAALEAEVTRLTNLISITSLAKDDFDQHLAVVKKMDQLTKRDFRGYLLTNIISYIDQKAKKYCETVFGTRELSLEINGNALDITYCGKAFDGLSGGEKQRVDLILQLAIRDLLNSYLNLSANILVLDEITDFLDKKSCKAVMQLLEKELNTVESVFIISHRSTDLELSIDTEITVIKNENGISEIY